MNRKFFTFIAILFLIHSTFAKQKNNSIEPVSIKESWGYVSMSSTGDYQDSLPLTDVLFFAADVNCYGELTDIPKRSSISVKGKRTHLVFICDSKSLTHFVLAPQYDVRNKIINQLVKAAQDFDGINIDLELIPAKDGPQYISFLKELRNQLPDKIFSVCVPARFKLLKDDIFPYKEISQIADRVFIMAYDEHWSTSAPGPIASIDWCTKITDYALSSIPQEKIVMGIPFYGRTWTEKNHAGAWKYSSQQKIFHENKIKNLQYKDDIPTVSYKATVKVTGYFNDIHSFNALANLYLNKGITNLGYWRIGQEDPKIWDSIKIISY